ncbi:hypothetical protein V8G54_037761 [Vigna mungo]|uniref:Uncharacterized protein n=1 Tax=Vigna mungo TaxID=3915 RepID=A0AAQ3RGT5_VIGMU
MANLARLNDEGVEGGDGVEGDDEVGGDFEQVHEGQEDGDAVEVNCVVDYDLEELHEGQEAGDGVQVDVEVDGDVEELHEVEGFVEDEVSLYSWSSSSDEGDVQENNEAEEGLVDVRVDCDIDDDVDGNAEVEVQSLSDEEWKSEELLSGCDSDEDDNDIEGYGRFEKQDILDVVKGYALENGRNINALVQKENANGDYTLVIWRLREFNLKLLDAKWLSKKLLKTKFVNKFKGSGTLGYLGVWLIEPKLLLVMWRAATVSHPENWEREMKNIKDVNEDAFKHLIAIPPR